MTVDVGYFGLLERNTASFRLRCYLPSMYLNLNFAFAIPGKVNWCNSYSKSIEKLRNYTKNNKIVFDIANNHFDDQYGEGLQQICREVETITCSSKPLQELIFDRTGRTAIIIPDVYETPELQPTVQGDNVVWFGHETNIESLNPYLTIPNLVIISKNLDKTKYNYTQWSLGAEFNAIKTSNVVLLTTDKKYCSPNRIIKALRAGKFVVTPNTSISEWNEYKDFIWQGDVHEGIEWVNKNKSQAIEKIKQGQDYIRDKFNPKLVAKIWENVFIKTIKGIQL